MGYKRINITIPEDDLSKINEFCQNEKLSKSFVIREATINYITQKEKERRLQTRRKNIENAIRIQDELRKKSKFKTNKTASELIRELRDKDKVFRNE
ncbi:MAG: ribbon-helix-helix protein, CopG family [Actinobacteria bacterium]|nr:ribbon-helix-helix protein, CopG family [Actinomycetota bacterium]